MTTLTTAGPASPEENQRTHRVGATAIVLGFMTVIAIAVVAFAAPAVNSGAHELPLVVSGPRPLASEFSTLLDSTSPGTFTVTSVSSPVEGRRVIRNGDAIGGVVLEESQVTIQTAAGAGPAYPSLLHQLGSQLASSGRHVTYAELVPTTADDPRSSAMTALGLPLTFGGMGCAAALLLAYRGAVRHRVVSALVLAALGGLAATGILQFGFGSFDGSFWLTALAVSAGIAAIGCTVLGLGTMLGYPGVLLAAVLMLFLANPLSGLANGPSWMPEPWGSIGQLLPIGATGTAVRSAAYFDGAGAAAAWWVLACWLTTGLLLASAGGWRNRSATTLS
jgi:hypothetical protein